MAIKGVLDALLRHFQSGSAIIDSGDTPIKTAHADVATSGDTTLVSAVSGSSIRVLSINLSADTAHKVTITDGSGGSALDAFYLGASTPVAVVSPNGYLFEGSDGTALVANLGAANNTSIRVTYVEV